MPDEVQREPSRRHDFALCGLPIPPMVLGNITLAMTLDKSKKSIHRGPLHSMADRSGTIGTCQSPSPTRRGWPTPVSARSGNSSASNSQRATSWSQSQRVTDHLKDHEVDFVVAIEVLASSASR